MQTIAYSYTARECSIVKVYRFSPDSFLQNLLSALLWWIQNASRAVSKLVVLTELKLIRSCKIDAMRQQGLVFKYLLRFGVCETVSLFWHIPLFRPHCSPVVFCHGLPCRLFVPRYSLIFIRSYSTALNHIIGYMVCQHSLAARHCKTFDEYGGTETSCNFKPKVLRTKLIF